MKRHEVGPGIVAAGGELLPDLAPEPFLPPPRHEDWEDEAWCGTEVEVFSDGSVRERGYPLSEKIFQYEDPFEAAQRGVLEELGPAMAEARYSSVRLDARSNQPRARRVSDEAARFDGRRAPPRPRAEPA